MKQTNGIISIAPIVAESDELEDTATDVARDVQLSWQAGENAGRHNVYLGTTFADVDDAVLAGRVRAAEAPPRRSRRLAPYCTAQER